MLALGGLLGAILPTCLYVYVEPRGRAQWATAGDSPSTRRAPLLVRLTAWLSFAVAQMALPLLLVPVTCGGLLYVQIRLGALSPVGLGMTGALGLAALVQAALAFRLLPLGVRLLARSAGEVRRVTSVARLQGLVHAAVLGGSLALLWAMSHHPRPGPPGAAAHARVDGAPPGGGVRHRLFAARLAPRPQRPDAARDAREGREEVRRSCARILVASLGTAAAVGLALLSSPAARADEVPMVAGAQQSAAGASFGGDDSAAEDLVPGEIAVDLRDDATDADIADLDSRYGLVMRASSTWSTTHDRLEVADVDPAREDALLDGLSHDPRVEHAEPMARLPRHLRARRSALRRQAVAPQARRRRDARGTTPAGGHHGGGHRHRHRVLRQGAVLARHRSGGHALRGRLELRRRLAAQRPTITATARTSRAPSRRPPTTASAPRGWRSAPPSCPIKVLSRQGFGSTAPTWPRASASPPTTARRSSTCRSAGPSRAGSSSGRRARARQGRRRRRGGGQQRAERRLARGVRRASSR